MDTSEYIGILYEGLLDYELRRVDGNDPVVFLALGDQPALPLSRLEGMDDGAIQALVEKVKKGQGIEAQAGDEEVAPEEVEDAEEGEEEFEAAPDDGDEPIILLDDARTQARNRAQTWARRAAIVGGLVRKSKGRGKKGSEEDPALDRAAYSLVADVRLPGELFLVRWGGTRKGAGTFYTRPQLTVPTVRRTLAPLLVEDGKIRSPEAILALKVCDPAMGSGSFLVAALRVLTEAIVEAIHVHGRVQPINGRTRVEVATFTESDRLIGFPFDDPRFSEELADRVKRYVVEHCLYGVDIDPLAVELARVALWVETLDEKLPFTFLDHKLRCGDALVGCWFDRFRDYPLLAWNRESPDDKHAGIHHPAKLWTEALKKRRKAIIEEMVDTLSGQTQAGFMGGSDDDIKAAVERVRALFRKLRDVPSDNPGERARIWRGQIHQDPAMVSLRRAFDTWCALWFWPLDRLAAAPGPRGFLAPSVEASGIVEEIAEKNLFFHWELEFPDVFVTVGAGFDAVVGNPPWETLQPQSMEFFSDLDPLYRSYSKQDGLLRQQELFSNDRKHEVGWLGYIARYKDQANWVRNAGQPYGDGEWKEPLCRKAIESEILQQKWRRQRARYRGFSDPIHPFCRQGEGVGGADDPRLSGDSPS